MAISGASQAENALDFSQGCGPETAFTVTFPQKDDSSSPQQDEEYAEVHIGAKKQVFRIHDYNAMYSLPGLYEHIVYEQLACDSPRVLVHFLKEHIAAINVSSDIMDPLDILDVAAGNGIVGAELRQQLAEKPGIRRLIATDLLESARSAALRDRPDVYDDYVVADLTQPHGSGIPSSLDVVTICAALGPGDGDLPLEAVDGAITLLREGGLLALTVNARGQSAATSLRWQNFLASVNGSGGSHWGYLEVVARKSYKHRKNVQGKWMEYMALIYKKKEPEPVDGM